MTLEAPAGLLDDVVEVLEVNDERPAREMLADLNSPGRIQLRGYVANAEQLLLLVIATWRINDESRFFLYDYDAEELVGTMVYETYDVAAEEADELSNVMVKRFQL